MDLLVLTMVFKSCFLDAELEEYIILIHWRNTLLPRFDFLISLEETAEGEKNAKNIQVAMIVFYQFIRPIKPDK